MQWCPAGCGIEVISAKHAWFREQQAAGSAEDHARVRHFETLCLVAAVTAGYPQAFGRATHALDINAQAGGFSCG